MYATGMNHRSTARAAHRSLWPALAIAGCLFLLFAFHRTASAGGSFELTVVKQAWMPNEVDPYPNDWSFDIACTSTGTDCADITLTDVDGSHTYTNLQEYNSYTLTETVPDGWTTTVSCENQDNVEIASGDDVVEIDASNVTSNDEVTCIFTNVADTGTITIVKNVDFEDDTDFDFTDDIEGSGFSLEVPSDPSTTFEDVSPGEYTVTEDEATNWTLDEISCDDPDDGSSVDTGDRAATIDLDPGEDVTCTFYNVADLGTITITKEADFEDDTVFDFTDDIEGSGFSLSDPSDDTEVFEEVSPGEYSVTEGEVTDWTLDDITCDDDDSTGDTGTRTATINLDPGENVTCIFYNDADPGTINILKDANLDNDTAFDFTEDIVGFGFTLVDDDDTLKKFEDVPPGTYTVTEDETDGWSLSSIYCDDDDSTVDVETRTATINVSPNEELTCWFYNDIHAGTIIIEKSADIEDNTAFVFDEDFAGFGFTLYDSVFPEVTFTGVPIGSYTVSERETPGWALVDITCDDTNNSSVDVGLRSAYITLEKDETVKCTFVNTKDVAELTVVKDTDPEGGQGFPFTLDPSQVSFVRRWGDVGSSQGQFITPSHLAVDGDGNVYVADFGNNRVQKFAGDGTFLLAWGWDVKVGGVPQFEICTPSDTCKAGSSGSGDGQFNRPDGVAVGDDGSVYVVEEGGNRVQKFTSGGVFVTKWGSTGGGGGQFSDAEGVAVDEDGNVYVADNGNSRVQKFTGDGTFLLAWGWDVIDGGGTDFEICTPADTCKAGVAGGGDGQFVSPTGVAVYGSRVYVSDVFNYRIQVFTTAGGYLDKWGSGGSADGQFQLPSDVAVDAAGNVYVVDHGNNRIQKFNGDGDFLTKWGSLGNTPGTFNSPIGVAVNAGGSVYVSDRNNHRIQQFTQTGAQLDDDESHTFTDLEPGTYFLNELVPDDWNVTDIDCDGGDPAESGNTVAVTLASGDAVICAFTNTYTEPPTTGTIVIVKEADPADDTEFSFTENIVGDGFSLSAPSNISKTFSDVPIGNYTVTEGAAAAGWALDEIDCDDVNSTFDTGTRTASIVLEADETVICTFYNLYTPPPTTGTIVIVKEADPEDDTEFSFTEDIASLGFSLTDPSDNTKTFSDVPIGGYSVTETAVVNWTQDSIVCNDPDDGSSTALSTATIDLDGGETVTCTFYNSLDRGTITIVKEADPEDDTEFDFTHDFVEVFGITVQAVGGEFTLKDPSHNSETFTVIPGSYSVTEAETTGWTLDDIDCDDTNSTGDTGTRTATINLTDDETVTCTFRNTILLGTISIVKSADPNDDTSFSFIEDIVGDGFNLQDPNNPEKVFNSVLPGEYTVTEAALAGWTLDDITCTDDDSTGDTGTRTATINLDPGETVTCTFYNSDSPTDIDPPETTIDTGPTGTTNNNDPTFTFSADETGSTFECKLDDGPWEACNSGSKSYTDVADGEHTFQVRATDAAGNTDATPASRTWTIDTTGPTVTITSAPAHPTNSTSATFQFSSDGATSFLCVLDSNPSTLCSSGQTYTGLNDGSHTFTVFAGDDLSNYGPPDSHIWVIDTVAPNTTIDSGPSGTTSDNDPSFTFSGDALGGSGIAGFECKLDGGDWGDCDSPQGYTDLADGEHTFQVRATDAAGNTDATPAGRTWTIDTSGPADAAVFVSSQTPGSVGGLSFGSEDILKWDGSDWSVWFDGSAAGLTARKNVHNINAFWIPDSAGDDVVLSFAQNRRFVPGIVPPVDGMDLVLWDGAAFSFWFDGSDVGLTNKTQEKIDGLHVLDGSESPIGSGCIAYLLVSTQGPGKVPNHSGGTLNFSGEDVLGFCATGLGSTTAGKWHKFLDGSDQGMPKNSTDSISLSADGEMLYFTTKGTFNAGGATGGHSMVYAYDLTTETFSGPTFIAADEGLNQKVDGLQVE